MPLTGPATALGIPNFAAADRPMLDASPGLPDITAMLDTLLQRLGALPLAGAFNGRTALAFAYNPGTQSFASGALTATTFSAAALDTDGIHPASGTRFTITHLGNYLLLAQLNWPSNVGGARFVQFMRNGAAAGPSCVGPAGTALTGGGVVHVLPLALNPADYIELNALQDSGAALTPVGGSFFVLRLGP